MGSEWLCASGRSNHESTSPKGAPVRQVGERKDRVLHRYRSLLLSSGADTILISSLLKILSSIQSSSDQRMGSGRVTPRPGTDIEGLFLQ